MIPWGWAYNNIPELGQDDLFTFPAVNVNYRTH